MVRPVFILLLLFTLLLTHCTTKQEGPNNTSDSTAVAQQIQKLPPRGNEETRTSPNASISQTIGTTIVTLSYGRPGVKGRKIFGELEPFNKVWRAGANEATVFATNKDILVNDQPLPAGVYAFFVKPTEADWEIIFNKEAEQWGAFNYDESKNILQFTVTPETSPHQEWLTFYFDNLSDTATTAYLHWDTTRIPFTITTAE